MSDSQKRRVIYTNDLNRLKNRLSSSSRKIRYLILGDSLTFLEIDYLLAKIDGSQKIDLRSETQTLRTDFHNKYVNFIASLNESNNSLAWWGLYFTRKEFLYTEFGQTIFNSLLVDNLIRNTESEDLVVITNDSLMVNQLSDWNDDSKAHHINDIYSPSTIRDKVRSFTLGRMILSLLVAISQWLSMRASLKVSIDKNKSYVVLASLINESCFTEDRTYIDTYFGELPEFLKRHNVRVLVLGGILRNDKNVLREIKANQTRIQVVPWFYHGSIFGISKAWMAALRFFFSPPELQGSTELDGKDFRHTIKHAIKNNLRTGHLFNSLWLYHSAKSLGRSIKISALAFPYENRSWEKMLMDGFAQSGNQFNTVGYHHAAIGPAHTNMVLGKNESDVLPLPDKILTVGEITEGILRNSGNYPPNTLKVGCALRQGRIVSQTINRNNSGEVINLLVALASSLTEYGDALTFLDKSFIGSHSYRVGIRPHPEFSLDQSLAQMPELNLQFQRMTGTLSGNLEWADVVIYISSTVGLEAISLGIPAISIDLGKFTSYDPAPNGCPMKWSISKPEQLVPTLQEIADLDDSEYQLQQMQGAEFGRKYFRPVTDETLAEFRELLVGKEWES